MSAPSRAGQLSPTGTVGTASNWHFVSKSTDVAGQVGTQFGIEFRIDGNPVGDGVTLHMVLNFPPQGIRNPNTGDWTMSKHFRPWNIDQTLLLPPNVRDFVPKDHVSRFIVELVRESLDLKAIMCSYVSGLGQPPFDPRMMVSLLLHGYASGLYSSRRIARACCERNDFVMIVALDPPDFRTISDFRKRHLKAFGELFLQVLKLCETLERRATTKNNENQSVCDRFSIVYLLLELPSRVSY